MYSFCITLITLLLLLAQPEKEKIIGDFFNVMDSIKYISYNVEAGYIDASKGQNMYDAECIFKIVPNDTVMGGYYFIKSSNSYKTWNGIEYIEYSPEYYNKNEAFYLSIKKNPEKFSDEIIEMDGQKLYAMPRVKNSFFLFASPIELKKTLIKIKDSSEYSLLNDTVINGYKCKGLRFIKQFSESDYIRHIVYFDDVTKMPVYHSLLSVSESMNYSMEEINYYKDYSFRNHKDKEVFGRKALPRGLKYLHKEPNKKQKSLKIGQIAPDWSLETLKDKKVSLEEYRGKPLFIVFSEIGCAPCLLAIPKIKELKKQFTGINIISIYPVDKKEALIKYTEKEKIEYDILYNSKNVSKEYLVNGYPTFFLIDDTGIIRYICIGYGESSYEEWIKEIEKLIK